MRQHLHKLAMIVVLGSGFALAQTTPQQPATPQGTSPSTPQTQPSNPDQQQPSTAPDQEKKPANAPETMPSTEQKKPDDTQKMPQSDAAPAATGDVQSNIQSAIQKDPTLATANVTVEVKDGKTVQLTGTVPNKDAKDTAERIAKENSGGLKVKNHLKVASAGTETTPDKPKSDMNNPKL